MTLATVQVLKVFLANPESKRWGYELLNHSGVKRSTLYPALTRLEDEGWLEGEWEAIDEEAAGRPARRYYRLTAEGQRHAPKAIADALTLPASLRPSLGSTS
jgi:DNA-binding PadR family transcriptional regulator